MEAAVSSEALITIIQFMWLHITRDHDLEVHCQDTLRPDLILLQLLVGSLCWWIAISRIIPYWFWWCSNYSWWSIFTK